MTLRSEVNYEVIKPVPDIGWRLRKHYFLVKSHINPKEEMLLSWVEHGPDKYLEDRDLQGVFKSISNLQVGNVSLIVYSLLSLRAQEWALETLILLATNTVLLLSTFQLGLVVIVQCHGSYYVTGDSLYFNFLCLSPLLFSPYVWYLVTPLVEDNGLQAYVAL